MAACPKPIKAEKEIRFCSLKPGQPLARKTPLATRTPLERRALMSRTPSKRSYGHLVKRGYCAVCGAAGATVWHHIIYRSQGGGEDDLNMLEVGHDFTCSCHRDIHTGCISRAEVMDCRAQQGSYLKEASA